MLPTRHQSHLNSTQYTCIIGQELHGMRSCPPNHTSYEGAMSCRHVDHEAIVLMSSPYTLKIVVAFALVSVCLFTVSFQQ